MTTRHRSIRERTRLRVMERDDFTCRRCARRPPTVQLVVEHVVSVEAGGSNAAHNLVTSCNECSLGVGAASSSEVAAPAVTEHQLDELRRNVERQREYVELQLQLDKLIDSALWDFLITWQGLFGGTREIEESGELVVHWVVHPPSDEAMRNILREEIPLDELRKTAAVVHRRMVCGVVDRANVQRYFLGCVRRLREKARGEDFWDPARRLQRRAFIPVEPNDATLRSMLSAPQVAKAVAREFRAGDFTTATQRCIFRALCQSIDADGDVDTRLMDGILERDAPDACPEGWTWTAYLDHLAGRI